MHSVDSYKDALKFEPQTALFENVSNKQKKFFTKMFPGICKDADF